MPLTTVMTTTPGVMKSMYSIEPVCGPIAPPKT
jgi:hypothetical protein